MKPKKKKMYLCCYDYWQYYNAFDGSDLAYLWNVLLLGPSAMTSSYIVLIEYVNWIQVYYIIGTIIEDYST